MSREEFIQNAVDEAARKAAQKYDEQEKRRLEQERKKREYEKFENDLKNDLAVLAEYSGITITPKIVDIIFNKAWMDRHSYGFEEVKCYASDLMDFVCDVLKGMK